MTKRIGFLVDKPKRKRSLLCVLGFHKASKFIIERVGETDYFVCKRCGKSYKIIT